jgi:hypothetical protein
LNFPLKYTKLFWCEHGHFDIRYLRSRDHIIDSRKPSEKLLGNCWRSGWAVGNEN